MSVSRGVPRRPMKRWIVATLEVILNIFCEMDLERRVNSGEVDVVAGSEEVGWASRSLRSLKDIDDRSW